MEFDWSNVGNAPTESEIEVTVIGPGFGESIVIHIGNGRWAIVDSCIDTRSTDPYPAPLSYLQAIGVDPATQVDLVVATHWHQDHIRGLSDVVRRCPAARFSCASAMLEVEFQTYLIASQPTLTATSSSKPQELLEIARTLKVRNQGTRFAKAGQELRTWKTGELVSCRAWALSPSDGEYEKFLQGIRQMMPVDRQPIAAIPPGDPNEVSVVVQVAWNDTSVLLGADMVVTADSTRGWKAVMVEHASLGLPKSKIVKIPHHGSHNAHYQLMWDDGLESDRIAVVAPYGRGALAGRPPKDEDLARISGLATDTYLTSSARGSGRPDRFESSVERTLNEGGIELSESAPSFGVVQLRRTNGQWNARLMPPARKVLPQIG